MTLWAPREAHPSLCPPPPATRARPGGTRPATRPRCGAQARGRSRPGCGGAPRSRRPRGLRHSSPRADSGAGSSGQCAAELRTQGGGRQRRRKRRGTRRLASVRTARQRLRPHRPHRPRLLRSRGGCAAAAPAAHNGGRAAAPAAAAAAAAEAAAASAAAAAAARRPRAPRRPRPRRQKVGASTKAPPAASPTPAPRGRVCPLSRRFARRRARCPAPKTQAAHKGHHTAHGAPLWRRSSRGHRCRLAPARLRPPAPDHFFSPLAWNTAAARPRAFRTTAGRTRAARARLNSRPQQRSRVERPSSVGLVIRLRLAAGRLGLAPAALAAEAHLAAALAVSTAQSLAAPVRVRRPTAGPTLLRASSQQRSHFLRHVKLRLQVAHALVGRFAFATVLPSRAPPAAAEVSRISTSPRTSMAAVARTQTHRGFETLRQRSRNDDSDSLFPPGATQPDSRAPAPF